jgi:hypothetical protein
VRRHPGWLMKTVSITYRRKNKSYPRRVSARLPLWKNQKINLHLSTRCMSPEETLKN